MKIRSLKTDTNFIHSNNHFFQYVAIDQIRFFFSSTGIQLVRVPSFNYEKYGHSVVNHDIKMCQTPQHTAYKYSLVTNF